MYHRNKEMTMKRPPPLPLLLKYGEGVVGVVGSISFFDTFVSEWVLADLSPFLTLVFHKMEWVSFCVNHADPVVRRYIL